MTNDQLLLLFLALHIIAAGIWISQFVAEMAFGRFMKSLKGKPAEGTILLAEGQVAALLGMIGGTGILITGLLLTAGFHYGILGIGGVYTPTWLVIKQIFYIIAMAIVGMVITRGSRKVMPLIGQAAAAGQPVPAEALSAFARIQMASNIVNLFVLINICLLYTSPSPRDGLLSRMPSSA